MPSTVIAAIDYAPQCRELTISFRSGRVYVYFGVPPATVEAFRRATSKGSFFNRAIRDRYPFRELPAPAA